MATHRVTGHLAASPVCTRACKSHWRCTRKEMHVHVTSSSAVWQLPNARDLPCARDFHPSDAAKRTAIEMTDPGAESVAWRLARAILF
jgi:hypothetical protein